MYNGNELESRDDANVVRRRRRLERVWDFCDWRNEDAETAHISHDSEINSSSSSGCGGTLSKWTWEPQTRLTLIFKAYIVQPETSTSIL